MYLGIADHLGWAVAVTASADLEVIDRRRVGQAIELLGEQADEVLQGPRARLGPPWTKDHRVALAATIVGD